MLRLSVGNEMDKIHTFDGWVAFVNSFDSLDMNRREIFEMAAHLNSNSSVIGKNNASTSTVFFLKVIESQSVLFIFWTVNTLNPSLFDSVSLCRSSFQTSRGIKIFCGAQIILHFSNSNGSEYKITRRERRTSLNIYLASAASNWIFVEIRNVRRFIL